MNGNGRFQVSRLQMTRDEGYDDQRQLSPYFTTSTWEMEHATTDEYRIHNSQPQHYERWRIRRPTPIESILYNFNMRDGTCDNWWLPNPYLATSTWRAMEHAMADDDRFISFQLQHDERWMCDNIWQSILNSATLTWGGLEHATIVDDWLQDLQPRHDKRSNIRWTHKHATIVDDWLPYFVTSQWRDKPHGDRWRSTPNLAASTSLEVEHVTIVNDVFQTLSLQHGKSWKMLQQTMTQSRLCNFNTDMRWNVQCSPMSDPELYGFTMARDGTCDDQQRWIPNSTASPWREMERAMINDDGSQTLRLHHGERWNVRWSTTMDPKLYCFNMARDGTCGDQRCWIPNSTTSTWWEMECAQWRCIPNLEASW